MPESADAWAELEARVARLEERLRPGPGSAEESVDEAEPFWALNELERRHPDGAVLYAGALPTQDGPVRWQMGHSSAGLMDEDWTVHASTLAALGHPSRLQILQAIARGEAHTAADLAQSEGLGTTGQIYHHLRQLVAAGWLRSTTRGRHEVPPERVVPLLVILGSSH
jgi:DNA-binding transcriptional ArsR family regulator